MVECVRVYAVQTSLYPGSGSTVHLEPQNHFSKSTIGTLIISLYYFGRFPIIIIVVYTPKPYSTY